MQDERQEPTKEPTENHAPCTQGRDVFSHCVCYADTDAGGIVYHGRYIEMSERARNQLMYHVGFSFARLADEYQVMLVTQRVEVTYFTPALLEDLLTLKTKLAKCRSAYSVWVTEVRRAKELIASVTVKIVFLDIASRKLARHPAPLVAGLSRYLDA